MIKEILDLAAQLPSGLPDPNALTKLNAEFGELLEMIEQGDRLGAVMEAGDVLYYVAKLVDLVAHMCELSIDEVTSACTAKIALRAMPGHPKDDAAERAAVVAALAGDRRK